MDLQGYIYISTYFLHSVEGRVLNFHEYGEEFQQLLTKEAENPRFLHEILPQLYSLKYGKIHIEDFRMKSKGKLKKTAFTMIWFGEEFLLWREGFLFLRRNIYHWQSLEVTIRVEQNTNSIANYQSYLAKDIFLDMSSATF